VIVCGLLVPPRPISTAGVMTCGAAGTAMSSCLRRSRAGLDSVRKAVVQSPMEPLRQSALQTIANGLSRLPVQTPTFLCCICLEHAPEDSRACLQQCGRPSHSACVGCLRAYLKGRVEEARVRDLRCPLSGDDGCRAVATEQDLARWLDNDLLAKYQRFSRMAADSLVRECPQCQALCVPSRGDDGEALAEMRCEQCGCAFCLYHAGAHEPGAEACQAYQRASARQERVDLLSVGARPCPECGAAVEKIEGCNHMTCRCGAEWCWMCGLKLQNVGWHYNPANPGGCMQYGDPHGQRMMICCKILGLPAGVFTMALMLVGLLFFIIVAPITLALTFPFPKGPKWGCFLAAFIVGAPLFAVFLIFAVVWGLFSCIIFQPLRLFCGANSGHLHALAIVPFATVIAVTEMGFQRRNGAEEAEEVGASDGEDEAAMLPAEQ